MGSSASRRSAEMEKNGNLKFLGNGLPGDAADDGEETDLYAGRRLWTEDSAPRHPHWIAVWKAIGADPVPLTLPELYPGLKSGKAEASEGDVSQITSFKLDEVQTHLIMTNHLAQTGGMLIYKPFFDGLSKADQTLVTMAAKQACDWANAKMKAAEFSYLLELQRKGMQVVIPDADSFRVKAKAAVEQLFKTTWSVTTWAEVLAQ